MAHKHKIPDRLARYFKKSRSLLCPSIAARYTLMDALRRRFPLDTMCRVLQVSRSGFYAWQRRLPSKWIRQEGR